MTRYQALDGARYAIRGGRLKAPHLAVSDRQGGFYAANVFQTGRRLMCQTVLPTKNQGQFATLRSQSSARRLAPERFGSARHPGLSFGIPLNPESVGPSRYQAARRSLPVNR